MTRVDVESITLKFADESSVGVLPGSPIWHEAEPDDIPQSGAEITLTARNPMSKNRQEQEPIVTDEDSGVEYVTDATMTSMMLWLDKFMYAQYTNWDLIWRGIVVAATGYTIPAASANQAGKVQWAAGGVESLFFARGYATAANNGIKVITADLGAAGTELTVSGLTAEAVPPANARVDIAGARFSTSDLALTVSGTTATLVSAADIADWSTLGLFAGQEIHVGGLTASEQFSAGAGPARIASISGATLNLDKIDPDLLTDPGTGDTVDILFGQFVRNVAVDANADGTRYQDTTQHSEISYPRSGTTTFYQYNAGLSANSIQLDVPLTDKVVMTVGMIGTTADDLTVTQKATGTLIQPVAKTAFNTGANIANLRTDAIATADAVCFKSLSITMTNNGSPEKCLGTQGATNVNVGKFNLILEAQAWLTGLDMVNAIKGNTTVTMDWQFINAQGAIAFDLPSVKLGGGGKEFPRNQTVLINTTARAFEDATFGHSIGISTFAAYPTA